MKIIRLVSSLMVVVMLFPLSSLQPHNSLKYSINLTTETNFEINNIPVLPNIPHPLDSIGISGNLFMKLMGRLESDNNYFIVNRFGYLGKYQFHKKTLKLLGYNKIQIKNFINSPSLQEQAMISLVLYNKIYFDNNGLLNYVGKNISGINVTLEGMLAAAHLRGPFAVKQFLITNGKINKFDANNTTVKDYMKQFENIRRS